MVFTAGKFILTLMHSLMHSEMLFVPHVHQPIIAHPAVRVDDAVEVYLAPDRSLWLLFGGSWDDLGVGFSLPFQDPEDNRFTACSTSLLPRTRCAPK